MFRTLTLKTRVTFSSDYARSGKWTLSYGRARGRDRVGEISAVVSALDFYRVIQ